MCRLHFTFCTFLFVSVFWCLQHQSGRCSPWSGALFGAGGHGALGLLYQALDPDQVVHLDSGFWETVITLPGPHRDLDARDTATASNFAHLPF